MYKIFAVDPTEYEEELEELHAATLGADCPRPRFADGFWWLSRAGDGSLAGFCGLEPSMAVHNAGYLVRAGVVDEHRGHGLQRRFIKVRERKARSLGWTILRSDTTDNIHSSNNLIRAGFTLFEPEIPWAFDNSLYWIKPLKRT